jgi:FkbM family methyltransferase
VLIKEILIKKANISTFDQIFSYVTYLSSLIRMFINYHRTYSGSFSMLFRIIRKKYPVEATLRNGNHIRLHDRGELLSFVFAHGHPDVEFNFNDDSVTIHSLPYLTDKKIKIKLYGAKGNADGYIAVFLKNEYQYLPVKGRTVIDIGTNIGDSAIYFALRGADKVIALEPLPSIYKTAKENIELNNLSNKINVLLAGCAGNTEYIDPAYESDISRYSDQFNPGKVPLLTLENILKDNKIMHNTGAILKMDCEGYEYDIILPAPCKILRHFTHIQIEYHSGYKNLKQKLEECNFNVSVTRPTAFFLFHGHKTMVTKYIKEKWQYLGYIYAKRN